MLPTMFDQILKQLLNRNINVGIVINVAVENCYEPPRRPLPNLPNKQMLTNRSIELKGSRSVLLLQSLPLSQLCWLCL